MHLNFLECHNLGSSWWKPVCSRGAHIIPSSNVKDQQIVCSTRKAQGHPDPSSVSDCPESVHPHGQWVCDCPDPALKESRVLGQSWRGRWHKHNTPETPSEIAWETYFCTLGQSCEEQESGWGHLPWLLNVWIWFSCVRSSSPQYLCSTTQLGSSS